MIFGLDKKDRLTVFEEIVGSAEAFVCFLQNTFLSEDKAGTI